MNLFDKDEKQKEEPFMYTEDQLMARLKFFIGICLSLTLVGIVFVVLYSIIFVTQPLNAMSPIDQKFFELLIPISTFLTGILSGIMLAGKDDKEAKMKAIEAATRPTTVSPNPTPSSGLPSSPRPMMPSPSVSASPFGAPPPSPFAPPPPPNVPPVSSGPPAPPIIPRPPEV
jgi:hypothetical protein